MPLPTTLNYRVPRPVKRVQRRVEEYIKKWADNRKYFFAFDKAGGLTLPTTWTDIAFDSVKIHDADAFRYAEGAVMVLKNLRVLVAINVTAEVSAATRRYFQIRLARNTGRGWGPVEGSISGGYARTSTEPYGHSSILMPIDLNKDDQIKLQGMSSHATEVTTTANACRMYVEGKNYGD